MFLKEMTSLKPAAATSAGCRTESWVPFAWLMSLLQEDPASSGKIMDYSQGLVNNTGDSNDLDMRFILFRSQNACVLFQPNVVLMLPVCQTEDQTICLFYLLSEQLQMANKPNIILY